MPAYSRLTSWYANRLRQPLNVFPFLYLWLAARTRVSIGTRGYCKQKFVGFVLKQADGAECLTTNYESEQNVDLHDIIIVWDPSAAARNHSVG